MIGRRVDDMSKTEKPGDYSVNYAENGEIASLWFILPIGVEGRIAAIGHGHKQTYTEKLEPEWTITEDDEGKVTVDPSIDYPDHWHGHLIAGVWSPG